MSVWEDKKESISKRIKVVERSYKPSKFKIMCDPPVATAPFSITLDEDKCIGCAVCIRQCPSQTLTMTRRIAPSIIQSPACQFNCPAGTDIREYLKLISEGGSLENAWQIITNTNPFPSITGRVCPHPCESACNRTFLDAALNINCIERAVGDYGINRALAFNKPAEIINENVAVVGSGPSGMSCAYHLAKKGYQVTVFEASNKPGGMLRYAIPSYRLSEEIVDKEIKRITDLGVTIKLGVSVGSEITLGDLKNQFKAVYVAVGAQGSTSLKIPGEDEDNVIAGLVFLRAVKENEKLRIGNKVVVIGGGNTAIDAARSARRLGSKVTVLYRRTLTEMPANMSEVEAAREEGVQVEFLCSPVGISKKGMDSILTCQKMELGEPDTSGRPRPVAIKGSKFDIQYDTLITAIGQRLDTKGIESLVGELKWISADSLGKTHEGNVFAGGDAVNGPGLVAQAIGTGRKAALAIDAFIRGIKVELPEKKEISFKGIPLDKLHHLKDCQGIERSELKKGDVLYRLINPYSEENISFSDKQVVSESKRCMGCGLFKPEFTHIKDIPYFGKVCIACHVCGPACAQGAITMPYFYRVDEGRWATSHDIPIDVRDGLPNPLRLEHPAPLKEIDSQITETEKVIFNRRSSRVFKTNPLPKEIIERIIEAGRFAPTAGNCLGFKFIIITDRKLLDELNVATRDFLSLFASLYRSKSFLRMMLKKLLCIILPNATDPRPMAAISGILSPQFGYETEHVFFNAPCAILIVPHSLHISDPDLAVGIVGQNMVLAAHSLGLGTCYVGLAANTLKKDLKSKIRFRKKLGLKWPYEKPGIFIALGYPAVKTDGPAPREFPNVEWI